jgi:MFS family permease
LWVAGLLVLLFTATVGSYFLAYAVMGAGAGMLMPGYMAGASLAVPAERQGAIAGLSAAAQGIGFTLAPAASTLLYEIDKALPLWCLVGLMALLFVLFAARTPATQPGESRAP